MNLRQIKYFCEIVDAGSAVHAAERLFIAPTAISMQLSLLEQHLGGDLFDRSRRPMELTPLGKFFYPRAKELLSRVKRLDQEAHDIVLGKRGWLGIGFTRSAIFSLLPTTIRAFHETHTNVHLDLVEVLTEYQPIQLHNGRIDIGISRFIGAYECPDGLCQTVMIDDPFVAALPVNHPLAQQGSVTVAELGTIPFILYPKDEVSPFGRQMLSILQISGSSPIVAYEAIEIHTALALVGAGLGGTIVGRSITKNNRTDVVFLPVTDLQQGTAMVAFTRIDDDSSLVSAFLEELKKTCNT